MARCSRCSDALTVAIRLALLGDDVVDFRVGPCERPGIELDDELVELAMRRFRLDSKRAAVQLALEKLVGEPMTRAEVLAMQGSGFELTNDEVEALSDADPATAG